MRTRLTILNCLLAGKLAGNFSKKSTLGETQALRSTSFQWFSHEFPTRKSREFFRRSRQFCERSREFRTSEVSVHCSHACFAAARRDLFSPPFLQSEEEQMADAWRPRERYGEAFWRAHHEGWRQSDLNQREYCEAQGLSLKAFGNWRAKFKAEPQPSPRKLLYRRSGLSPHRLS